jgi:hypothetical protein
MRLIPALALACLLAGALSPAVCAAQAAQAATAAPADTAAALADAAAAPFVLQPFTARYRVLYRGHDLGTATLQLTAVDDRRWQLRLDMQGAGLLRLTGLNASQRTDFQVDGTLWRPLRQERRRRVFLSSRDSVGTYDWARGVAQWTGDVKSSRRAPVAIAPGDMDSLMLDLAAIRDATPGATLHYRLVEDGRARAQTWQVAQTPETIAVGDLSYDALRVTRSDRADADGATIWVANGVPTPIRLLQREDGEDATELRLLDYQ